MTSDIDENVRAALGSHPEIRLAILFGSMASDRASRDSDVDSPALALRLKKTVGFRNIAVHHSMPSIGKS
ncbi:MAG: hypothetical protein IV108_02135 [Burkholderiales bacterium]|nr:hypothetical protein [Burkholderiales bacterium]